MISSSHPAFAKLGPKLTRAQRELDNLEEHLRLIDALHPGRISTWGRTTAVGTAIANVYNGIESVLEDLAKTVDGSVPSGETWHQDLLDQMLAAVKGGREAVLDESLHGQLTELKRFRHVVRHNYGFDLDPMRTSENLDRIRRAFPAFVNAVQALERTMTMDDEDADEADSVPGPGRKP